MVACKLSKLLMIISVQVSGDISYTVDDGKVRYLKMKLCAICVGIKTNPLSLMLLKQINSANVFKAIVA